MTIRDFVSIGCFSRLGSRAPSHVPNHLVSSPFAISSVNKYCEVMAELSVGRGNKQAELSSSSPDNRMYAKILLKRNNTPRLSPWTFDSRRRSLVLRPLPLTFEERMLRRRQHLAHLLLRASVSNGTFKTSFA